LDMADLLANRVTKMLRERSLAGMWSADSVAAQEQWVAAPRLCKSKCN